jgi:hypothetical protein
MQKVVLDDARDSNSIDEILDTPDAEALPLDLQRIKNALAFLRGVRRDLDQPDVEIKEVDLEKTPPDLPTL